MGGLAAAVAVVLPSPPPVLSGVGGAVAESVGVGVVPPLAVVAVSPSFCVLPPLRPVMKLIVSY